MCALTLLAPTMHSEGDVMDRLTVPVSIYEQMCHVASSLVGILNFTRSLYMQISMVL